HVEDPASWRDDCAPVPEARQQRQAVGGAPVELRDDCGLCPADLRDETDDRWSVLQYGESMRYYLLDESLQAPGRPVHPGTVAADREVGQRNPGAVSRRVLAEADHVGQQLGDTADVPSGVVERSKRELNGQRIGGLCRKITEGASHRCLASLAE